MSRWCQYSTEPHLHDPYLPGPYTHPDFDFGFRKSRHLLEPQPYPHLDGAVHHIGSAPIPLIVRASETSGGEPSATTSLATKSKVREPASSRGLRLCLGHCYSASTIRQLSHSYSGFWIAPCAVKSTSGRDALLSKANVLTWLCSTSRNFACVCRRTVSAVSSLSNVVCQSQGGLGVVCQSQGGVRSRCAPSSLLCGT